MENPDDERDEKIKVILVGESGVGKTNLINIATGMGFNEDEHATMLSSYLLKEIEINGKIYNLAIWDTIGQEKLRSLTKIFFKKSKIAILVYDIANRGSFEQLPFWENSLKEMADKDIILGVAGNKKDLFKEEQVTEEEGENYAKSINAKFKLTSAKIEPKGFNDFLEELLIDYINNHKERPNTFTLNNKNKKKKKKCNC